MTGHPAPTAVPVIAVTGEPGRACGRCGIAVAAAARTRPGSAA
jgi:hypothetical protein